MIDRATNTDHCPLAELLEPFSCNGGWHPIAPGNGEPFGGAFVGLTDAPCITNEAHWDDDGRFIVTRSLWAFTDYCITSWAETLLKRCAVEFQRIA